jgi:hypothetical protein
MEDRHITFMTIVFPVARAGPTFHDHMRTFFWERRMSKKKFRLLKDLTGEVPCVITSNETKISRMLYSKLTWNNLAYDADGFMTSVYQLFLIGLIKTQGIEPISRRLKEKKEYQPRWIGQ